MCAKMENEISFSFSNAHTIVAVSFRFIIPYQFQSQHDIKNDNSNCFTQWCSIYFYAIFSIHFLSVHNIIIKKINLHF